MKKHILLSTMLISTVLASCGDSAGEGKSAEKSAKICKTDGGDVEVSCEDIKALHELEEMDLEFHTGILVDIDVPGALEANTAELKKIEHLMPAIGRLMEKDENLVSNYYVVSHIIYVKEETAKFAQIIKDLELIDVSAAWEQDPLFDDEMATIVRFKNTTENDISKISGKISYYDVDGNVLKEGDIEFYSFHFEPKEEEVMTPGYEGMADKGLLLDDDAKAIIDSVSIVIDEIAYAK